MLWNIWWNMRRMILMQLLILNVLVSGANPITNHCQERKFTVMCTETSRSQMTECLESRNRNVSVTCKSAALYISLNCTDKRKDSTHRCCDVSRAKGEMASNRIAKATCLVNFLPCEEKSNLYRAAKLSCEWENSTLNISATPSQTMGLYHLCNKKNKEKSVGTSELRACLAETKSLNKTIERNGTLTNRTAERLVKALNEDIQTLAKPFRNCTALSIQELLVRIEDYVRPFLHNILVSTATNKTFSRSFSSSVVDFYTVVTADLQTNLTAPVRTDLQEPLGSISLSPGLIPLEHGNSNSKDRLGLVIVVFKFANSCENVPIIGKVYSRKDTSFPRLESPVISVLAMTKQGIVTKLKGNATLRFKIKKRPLSPKCVFLNRTALPENAWSTVGMTNGDEPDENYTLCKTDHLTSFAVLIGYSNDMQEWSSKDTFALDLITKIGCAFALICLATCILTFGCVRSLSAMRYRIHLNLCVALSVAILLFVTGIEATQIKGICIAIAVMLHYFFTAAFTWMCVEAIHLFFKIVSVFHERVTRMRNYMVVGWGLPAVIVALSAAIHHEGYSTAELCWLSSKRHFIWAFIAPVIIIILINVIVLVAVVFVRLSLKGNPLRPEDNRRFVGALKAVVILFPLLGLTWLFGFMGVITRNLLFLYAFAALSSLQGVFILLFQCIGNNEVRGSIKAIKERHSMKSSLRLEMENRQRETRSLNDCGNGTNKKRKGGKKYFRKLSACTKSKRQPSKLCQDV